MAVNGKRFLSAMTLATPALAIALGAGLAPVAAQGNQTNFESADWFEREIGEGVVWRNYEFDNLFGVRQSVSYIKADLNNPLVSIELPFLQGSTQRTSTLVPNQVPDALGAVNGTYFATGGHNTYLRIDDTEIPYMPRTKGTWGHHGALGQDTSDNWSILEMPTTGNEWDDNTTHPNIMANGPLLLLNGSIATTQINSAGGTHCTGRHPRTAVGITGDNQIILLTVDGRTNRSTGMTCVETATVLQWLGALDAVNMDGGGTTTMWVGGEPASGVVNYPSDGSGERVTANAIAIVSDPADPAEWDARLLSMTFDNIVAPEDTQTVTLVYENIGTETWTAGDTRLVTSRPTEDPSDIAHSSWVSTSEPATMTPATVAPGQSATFSFTVEAPDTENTLSFTQFFMLTHDGIGRIGPNDARARFQMTVIPETPAGDSFLVEPRVGGQNYNWYSDHPDFANSTVTSGASGATSGIGSRWTSSFFSHASVGLRTAQWRPNFSETGIYHVSVSWANTASERRNPIGYYVDHAGGRDTVMIDQTAPGDTWYSLGVYTFNEGQSDNGRVIITNEYTDLSGNMWAGPVRFILLEDEGPTNARNWTLYE
ncbi:MAG: phosphodiester glycosidase family protein [Candidatus Sumerlaeia bacterium]|nr:phosphodiester glycosidase family protein [Candidatus Sumerlaeia bacterium]